MGITLLLCDIRNHDRVGRRDGRRLALHPRRTARLAVIPGGRANHKIIIYGSGHHKRESSENGLGTTDIRREAT